ncbi:MAG TPA: class I SAM-dependent methyltransferase, partial [Clostridiales bacterium]|nr:class I SAM-dependent methyltransferase [Clostridiales bacterium]
MFRNSAWLYDVDNRDILSADIPFYIEFAKKQNGEILELGCGTGRVSLVLAAEGFYVTGLDLSRQML